MLVLHLMEPISLPLILKKHFLVFFAPIKNFLQLLRPAACKKCLDSEFFWSDLPAFELNTENYTEIKSPY